MSLRPTSEVAHPRRRLTARGARPFVCFGVAVVWVGVGPNMPKRRRYIVEPQSIWVPLAAQTEGRLLGVVTQLGIHCTMVFGTSGWPVSSLFRHIGFCMAMSGTLVWLEHHPSHPSSPVGPGHDQIHKVPRCTKYTPRWIRSVLPLVPHISIGSLSGSERSRILLAARHRKREEHVTFSQLGRPRHGEAHNINTSRKTDGSHAIQRYWALALGPKSRIFITKVV